MNIFLNMMRVLLSCLLVIFASGASGETLSEQVSTMQKHSDTYYWLSLSRNNDLLEVRKSLDYLQDAKRLISAVEDMEVREKLDYQVDTAIDEANTQLNKYSGQLNNYSPIFSQLLGKENILTRKDNGDLLAAKSSVIASFGVLPAQLKTETTLFTIVITADGYESIDESIHDLVTDNSSFYPVSRHELAMLLSQEEFKQLQINPIPEAVLQKIANGLGDSRLGILRVEQLDKINTVSYWQSTFKFWGEPFLDIPNVYYTTGVAEHVTDQPYLILFMMLLGFPFVFVINWIYRKEQGSSVPQWFSAAIAIVSFCLVHFAFKGLGAIGINEQAFYTNLDGYRWVMLVVAVINLFPLIIIYILVSRVPRISPLLNTAGAISTLIFGVFVGSYNYLGYLAAYRLGHEQALLIIVPAFLVVSVLSTRLGIAWSNYLDTNKPKALVEASCFSLWLYVFTAYVFKWNFDELLITSAAVLLLTFITKYVVDLCVYLFEQATKENKQEVEDGLTVTGIEWFSQAIMKPVFFNAPWVDRFNAVVNFIVEDSDKKIEVVFIEGNLGSGKTRTAVEIGEAIQAQYATKGFNSLVFFGSCEDNTGAAVTSPYGPFAQALSDHLGIGRFSDPSERAEKLQSGLLGAGLNMAMTATGTGALTSLLDSDTGEAESRKTNTREIANVVCGTLVDLAKESGCKLVFILDDTQWMDEESFELFSLILDLLSKGFESNELSFVLTSRPVDDADKVKTLLIELNEQQVINLNTDINSSVLETDEIVKSLLKSLRFEYRSQQALISYFSNLGIIRPLYVLQTLETLLKKQLVQPYGDRFVISDINALNHLPASRDYENMLRDLLGECDERLIDILHCCALIGQQFKISVVAEIFNMDELEFIGVIREAEKAKILFDDPIQDDVYAFFDKRVRNGVKSLSFSKSSNEALLTQRTRIYHKRLLSILESEEKLVSSIPYTATLELAYHAFCIKDMCPDKAVHYNRLAAEKTYEKGLTNRAISLYKNALSAAALAHSGITDSALLELYISYCKCLLDAQQPIDEVVNVLDKAEGLSLILNSSDEVNVFYKNEIMILRSLAYYRLRKFEQSIECAQIVISDSAASQEQKCRSSFYRAASLSPSDQQARYDAHSKVIDDIDAVIGGEGLNGVKNPELLKIKSEALNNMGFILLFGLKKPVEAILYFKQALAINELPSINDLKGMGISHGGLGDCYRLEGEITLAVESYEKNLKISEDNGDLQGVCRMHSTLGQVYLENATELGDNKGSLDDALTHYEKSLEAAFSQNSGFNVGLALSGLFKVGIASGETKLFGYVFKEFGIFIERKLHENLPVFPRETLKTTLEDLKEIAPKYTEEVDVCLSKLVE